MFFRLMSATLGDFCTVSLSKYSQRGIITALEHKGSVMTIEELLSQLFKQRSIPFRRELSEWLDISAAFLNFCQQNALKIAKKLATAKSDEDVYDIRSELEIALLLCENKKLSIEYEKYESSDGRAPDFFVTYNGTFTLNVEVARIRESAPMKRYNSWLARIRDAVKEFRSPFFVYLDWTANDNDPQLLQILEEAEVTVVASILDAISSTASDTLTCGKHIHIAPPGINHLIGITITRPEGRHSSEQTYFTAGIFPLFYTNKEYRKFGDIILDKLSQLFTGQANVLAPCVTSSTHEFIDLEDSLLSLSQQSDCFYSQKGYRDKAHFDSDFSWLSAIFLRSMWSSCGHNRNQVWCTANAAYPFPHELVSYPRTVSMRT